MKNFTLIIMVVVVQFVTAQTNVYHPFPTSNATWRVNFSTGGMVTNSDSCGPCSEYQYQITGDTVINGCTYHNIMQTGRYFYYDYNLGCYFNIPTCPFSTYKGAIREDSTAKKVYIYGGTDTLLYDFTLHVGDTVKSRLNIGCPNMTVYSMDSILIGNQYRKEWNVSMDCGTPASIIEGIGSTYGLLEPLYFFESGGELVCFSQNDTSLYPTDSTGNCALITSGIGEISIANNEVSIFPNPATTGIILHSQLGFRNYELRIEDVLGNKIHQQTISGNDTQIDVSTWSEGVYFYEVREANETVRGKFIKE